MLISSQFNHSFTLCIWFRDNLFELLLLIRRLLSRLLWNLFKWPFILASVAKDIWCLNNLIIRLLLCSFDTNFNMIKSCSWTDNSSCYERRFNFCFLFRWKLTYRKSSSSNLRFIHLWMKTSTASFNLTSLHRLS